MKDGLFDLLIFVSFEIVLNVVEVEYIHYCFLIDVMFRLFVVTVASGHTCKWGAEGVLTPHG